MDPLLLGALVAVATILVLFSGVSVALGLLIVSGGFLVAFDGMRSLELMPEIMFGKLDNFALLAIPMFILMGASIASTRAGADLYEALERWLTRVPGGLVVSNLGACALFSAMSGSSPATCAAIGKMGIPEMRKRGYPDGIAAGSIAAGGTLGILIPPSVVLVIYAILTEQNIAKLFLAAFVPGILAALGYALAIAVYVRVNPGAAGTRPPVPWAQRWDALWRVWPVLLVFLAVVGGIYGGVFTPTEGAAVGALGTGLIALANGGLTGRTLIGSFLTTARSTAMIFFIVLGAGFYNGFLALTRVPQSLSEWVVGLGLAPVAVLAAILLVYLVFGCLMDSLSMILLTVPIFFPVISALDFGMSPEEVAIWFGILVLIVVEVGLITPPVGMNLFVINSMDRATPILATYRAVIWFVGSDVLRVVLLVAFPSITLFLLR
jgi:tripartite ATP-independent transporter DctM subunit